MSPRDWRAKVALLASIGGAMALTLYAAATLYLLAYQPMWADRIDPVAKQGFIALGGALVVLVSLGMAINRRSFKISKDGIEAAGGDTEQQP
jgi:hypothetical protein